MSNDAGMGGSWDEILRRWIPVYRTLLRKSIFFGLAMEFALFPSFSQSPKDAWNNHGPVVARVADVGDFLTGVGIILIILRGQCIREPSFCTGQDGPHIAIVAFFVGRIPWRVVHDHVIFLFLEGKASRHRHAATTKGTPWREGSRTNSDYRENE